MKTIGLLGGMSWESTIAYYQRINLTVNQEMGGLHSAKCLLYSVDFQEIEDCQSRDQWEKSAEILAGAARDLERGGADFLILCTNTMHKVAEPIQAAVGIPLIHIVDVTLEELRRRRISRVGLLGTRYTMEQEFYRDRLARGGVETLIPPEEEREMINSVIFDELCQGAFYPGSRAAFLKVTRNLRQEGAEAVILGCTEIGLLIRQEDTEIPLLDTTALHSEKAARLAMGLE
mgnify:CR=1 FL=1